MQLHLEYNQKVAAPMYRNLKSGSKRCMCERQGYREKDTERERKTHAERERYTERERK
jgi:hypothetical protein